MYNVYKNLFAEMKQNKKTEKKCINKNKGYEMSKQRCERKRVRERRKEYAKGNKMFQNRRYRL